MVMAWLAALKIEKRSWLPQWLTFRRWLQRWLVPAWLGSLRSTKPLSADWGFDRGRPVDRYYIESFLEQHRDDVHGHVLEILSSDYADKFGAVIERVDILDIDPKNRLATVVADLAAADSIDESSFDCFILTQTLQFIFDVKSAIAHAYRILRPGGILLATVPAVSRIAEDGYTDYWRFTPASCARLFADTFGAEHITITVYGNVLSAVAFLEGMACEEFSKRDLDVFDKRFPVILAIRAVKA
jgi:SAM-dependent methyltransferase